MKNTLSIVLRTVLTSLILLACIQLQAQTSIFSPREQQSISCETPGLFSRSQAFSVDFGQIGAKDYSFPLPVGKVLGTRKNNNIIISTTKGDAVKAMFSGTVRLSRNRRNGATPLSYAMTMDSKLFMATTHRTSLASVRRSKLAKA